MPAILSSRLAALRSGRIGDYLGLALVALIVVWLVGNAIQTPGQFFQVALIGLTNGAVYGLVALGYTLVYGILQLINFAHGDVFALSGLFASTMIVSVIGLGEESSVLAIVGGLLATLVVVTALFGVINAGIERIAYKPLRHAPRLAPLITAVGVSFVVQNVGLAIYGVDFEAVPAFIPTTPVFEISGVAMSWKQLSVLLIVAPVLVLLTWFVQKTRQGKAMRAVAQDRDAAAIMGIDVNRTVSITFLLAGALAGVAGIVFLLQFNMRYDTGFELGLIAFTAAVLGGIGNLSGALLGALVIGFIQAFNEGLLWLAPGSDWTRSIVFGILIAILVFRPEGLLGERSPEGA